MIAPGSPWVVLKFGGTSVSSLPNWTNIVRVVRERVAAGEAPVVVHSAVSRVTDALDGLLTRALEGRHQADLEAIGSRHQALADELGIALPQGVRNHLADLEKIAAGIALVGEVSDRGARPGHGDRRADGDRARRGVPERPGCRDHAGRCPPDAHRRRAARRHRSRGAAVRHLCLRPGSCIARAPAGARHGHPDPGLHRRRRGRTHRAARARRLRHLRGVHRGAYLPPRVWRSGPTCRECSRRTRATCRPHAC